MASERVLALLRQIPLFGDLTSDEIVDILRVATPVEFKRGDVLCKQGDAGDCMYVIQAGTATVSIEGEGGRTVPVATLKEGDLLGEMTLIDSEPRSADVVAASTCRTFRIDRDRFEVLRGQGHPAAFKVLRRIALTTCARLRKVNATVSQILDPGALDEQGRVTGHVQTRRSVRDTEANRSFWSGLLGKLKG